MTFDEAKNLLLDMRAAKRRANSIKARIADLESDYVSIQSALGYDGLPKGSIIESSVERLVVRVYAERDKYLKALEKYFVLEDKLAAAINSLDPTEQEIIIKAYMEGKANWQISQELYMGLRTVERKKSVAIKKISQIVVL